MFDSDLFIKQTLIYSDLQMRNIKSDSSFEGNNGRSADNTKFQSLSRTVQYYVSTLMVFYGDIVFFYVENAT